MLRAVVPWLEDPLDFLHSPDEMSRESWFLYEDGTADDSRGSALFHVVRGSVAGPGDLPWLDVEQASDIAVNRRTGDDVSIALDYRTDPSKSLLIKPIAGRVGSVHLPSGADQAARFRTG